MSLKAIDLFNLHLHLFYPPPPPPPLPLPLFSSLLHSSLTGRIEPEWYCPIMPMVLVNGCDGIGTGYSTSVPNYNPREIVGNLRRLMNGLEPVEMV